MAEDPYKTLGVERSATPDDIRKAYRSAAKKSHPDLHPGDAAAETRFKTLNAANDLLSDPDKRARFDRGEIDAEGQPVQPERTYYRDYAQSAAGARYGRPGPGSGPGADEEDLQDIFGSFFKEQANQPRRGRDRSYRLDVPFLDSINGATQRLTLPDGATIDVRIPAGLTDGQVLRLRGKGDPGQRGAPNGDALIECGVLPHTLYRREGADLVMDLPVTFAEAALGCRIEVPTPRGRVTLGIPPKSDTGARLRLRGRGVAARSETPAGDLYAVLTVFVGPTDEGLETFLKDWLPGHDGTALRAKLGDGA